MSLERFGLSPLGSFLLILLFTVPTTTLVAQSPQVPASVTSYPIQDPTGLQNPVVVTSPNTSVSTPLSNPSQDVKQASINDEYQVSSSNEIIAVEDSPVDMSLEDAEELIEEAVEVIDGDQPCLPPSFKEFMLKPYRHYREDEGYTSYMPGDGDQFGWLTFGSNTWQDSGANSGIEMNFNLHLLSGPEVVALPPRLYDFEIGYQAKDSLSEYFSYDYGLSVGIYSDFEDSARDGVRFPAHLVGMYHPSQELDWVFGVEYLDRDDIKILPVIGVVWHDSAYPGLRVEAVFPRPRIDLQLQNNLRLYWTARLGGGSWDIEMPDDSNDVFTYRDYQILMGLETLSANKELNAWEFGFVFSRHLQFRNRPDEVNLDEAFVLRHVTRY